MNAPLTLNLSISLPVRPVHITDRVLATAALFGLGIDQNDRHPLLENLCLTLTPGQVILITGDSGTGKSTLLRALETRLRAGRPDWPFLRLESIALPLDRALVDCFDCPLEQALAHLARAGLSDARLLLRTPAELSEGQRFRYRLARFFASPARILLADEFAATLDRITAQVVAWQLQKFIRASRATLHPRSALLATTHEDLTADLQPDHHLGLHVIGRTLLPQRHRGTEHPQRRIQRNNIPTNLRSL